MARAETSVKVLDLPEVKAYIVEVNERVERMRAVVEAAGLWRHGGRNHQEQVQLLGRLMDAVDAYKAADHVE